VRRYDDENRRGDAGRDWAALVAVSPCRRVSTVPRRRKDWSEGEPYCIGLVISEADWSFAAHLVAPHGIIIP
jgi:hypothetical protein